MQVNKYWASFDKLLENTNKNKVHELPKGLKIRDFVKKMQEWESKKGTVTFPNSFKNIKNINGIQFGDPVVVEEQVYNPLENLAPKRNILDELKKTN